MITMATAEATNAAPRPATRAEILPDLGACAGACCDAACCEADCCEAVCGMAIPLCQNNTRKVLPRRYPTRRMSGGERGASRPRVAFSGHPPPSIGVKAPMINTRAVNHIAGRVNISRRIIAGAVSISIRRHAGGDGRCGCDGDAAAAEMMKSTRLGGRGYCGRRKCGDGRDNDSCLLHG